MSIVLQGSTSGSVTLQEPAVAGTTVLDLPATSGALFVTGQSSAVTSGTAVASTSGTSINFTGIPSWVKRVTVILNQTSLNGNSPMQVRIGTSSGVESSGYFGTATTTQSTNVGGYSSRLSNGFQTGYEGGAQLNISGLMTIVLVGSNTWCAAWNFGSNNGDSGYIMWGGGSKALSGTLDRIQVIASNGTDAFDNGTINIFYE
jgi:hypothetical protein